MNRAKLILPAGICLVVATTMASGCSSSSRAAGPVVDSGAAPDVQVVDSSTEAGGARCNPFTVELCPENQTCCFSGLGGTCTEVGYCGAPFQVSCVNTATCGGSKVCCVSVRGASTLDASASDPSGSGLILGCAASCSSPDVQICTTSQDCPSGLVCGGGPTAMGGNPAASFIMVCIPAGGAEPDASFEGGASQADAGDGGLPADAAGDGGRGAGDSG